MRVILIIVIAALCYLAYTNYAALDDFEADRATYQANVGKMIVIDVDTFMVVDFNQVLGEYTLGNGLVVNKLLVEANRIKDPRVLDEGD